MKRKKQPMLLRGCILRLRKLAQDKIQARTCSHVYAQVVRDNRSVVDSKMRPAAVCIVVGDQIVDEDQKEYRNAPV